jgi:hypothetical protein
VANRKHSARRIKKRRSYNVREVAKATGATPGTVRRWHKAGLTAVEGISPLIFRGVDIIDFLKRRVEKRKQPTGPGRMHCFRCKEPKRPAFSEVEYWPDGPKGGRLTTGLCPDCATIMNKRTSLAKPRSAAGDLRIAMQCADSRLSETPEHNCNAHCEGA